jgi:hypothetical protein
MAIAVFTFLFSGKAVAGEPIRCTCLFQQSSGYSAVGTRAACSTMTRKNQKGPGERCEIAFGGLGYDPRLLSNANIGAEDYRKLAFSVTQQNLEALSEGHPERLSDPSYLRIAIPVYMRAAYLRSDNSLEPAVLADLDKQVTSIAKEYADKIAYVFSGKAPPFEATWLERNRITVERGAVRIIYESDITLVAVFFDPEALR